MFEKILIANRGEIAVRIIKVCKEIGIKSVAIYSEADKDALHTKMADEAICIGPAPSGDSYLNMENIISAAVGTGAQAIHPGFGFLSENSLFAEKCKVCNITFIGPTPEVICKMGNKVEARNMMRNAGVPIISGSRTPVFDVCEAKKVALELGFPIMIKAAAGGGGKGMRISNTEDDFNENFVTAQMEANSSFRDGTMYLERYIEAPNHIEFQILADKYGNVIQLGERDCSIQRHHQKIIEEAPSPKLSVKLRKEMGNIAIKVAKIVNYEGAGTVEFLLDKFGKYYFIEMNTRIQVEHGITEMISNVDIVKEQIKIAAGYSLEFKQENILLQGHAIECRINAENPKMGFVPCPGKINNVYFPSGNGVRIDTALFNGCSVSPFYDSMLAKIIVYDSERKKAIRKMKNVLKKIKIDGIITNLEFQNAILNHRDFEEGNFTTDFIVDKFS